MLQYCDDFVKELVDERNAGKIFYQEACDLRDQIFENAARKMVKPGAEKKALELAKVILDEKPKAEIVPQDVGGILNPLQQRVV